MGMDEGALRGGGTDVEVSTGASGWDGRLSLDMSRGRLGGCVGAYCYTTGVSLCSAPGRRRKKLTMVRGEGDGWDGV